MAYTGGELNELNGKMGISAPKRSVPVMKLIKIHKPKSKDALVELIEYHKNNKCACGVVSTGTVKEFGERLFESQEKYWQKNKYTLGECIQWEYDLFVVQSLKGGFIEKNAISILKDRLSNMIVEEAKGYLDDVLRVDIIIFDLNKNIIGGIQVKPKTFKNMRPEVQLMQSKQNVKWGHPVWMLYYNRDDTFKNLNALIEYINNNKAVN
ncbi:MjaI family restriction endonuclease [Pseudalgibacter alginicilyticus]|nr:MjaI family restriction endonuclease [Pseudalgibacter alginicilyticus]